MNIVLINHHKVLVNLQASNIGKHTITLDHTRRLLGDPDLCRSDLPF